MRAAAPAQSSDKNAPPSPKRLSVGVPLEVSNSLQAFASVVAGKDGLSDARLVRLGAELARCADGEFSEAAQRCQVWV